MLPIEGVVTAPPSSVNQVFEVAVTDANFAASNGPALPLNPSRRSCVGWASYIPAIFYSERGPYHCHEQL
jgi:hypothetical protein